MQKIKGDRMKSCPKCKSNMIIDIEYGFPSDEMTEDANSNKIELGGCCIGSDDHKYKCKSCGKEFGGSDDNSYDWVR